MPGPKDKLEKMLQILNGWRTLAPNKTFGGQTVADFEATVAASQQPRQRLEELEAERQQVTAQRDAADDNGLAKARLVVAGVLADPDFGPDSALYESFGYTPDRDRKTGLTRRKKTKEPDDK
jgi:hypothetical protein